MSDSPRNPCFLANITVPIDVSDRESWQIVLPLAVGLAKSYGAALHFVTVVPELYLPTTHQPEQFIAGMVERARELLAEIVANNVPGDVKTTVAVTHGSIYRQIIVEAEKQNADLILMNSHRPGMKSYLLGSNAARVTRYANCSVYIVRA